MNFSPEMAAGFMTAFSPEALLFCFIGVALGTVVGILPGIGPLAAVSMMLPTTFYMDPTIGLIMLAGIFYGAQYGGSTASILLNIPGTASAAITCLDGYPLAQQGRAGVALFVTTITSFIGGSIAILLLMGFAPLVAELALRFGAPEYFCIMLLGLVAASTLSTISPLKGLLSVAVGVSLGLVGIDMGSGMQRYTFGYLPLIDGISLVSVAMGLFGIAEILSNVGQKQSKANIITDVRFSAMLPRRSELGAALKAALRGSGIGSFVGALPGAGPSIAAFIAYALEKRIAKDPSRFGKGAIEGISGPEAANNASVQAAFIPTLSLGIPGDAVMAVLLGALLIHGVTPGPQFLVEQPTMFWGLVASFWIGNLFLLILNIPLIGLWVKVLKIPYHILYPAMLFFICIGVYSVRNSVFDIYTAAGFGVLGYFMLRLNYPTAPLLLGFILGPLMEDHFKRGALIAGGDLEVFITRPISATLLTISALMIIVALLPVRRWFGIRV